MRRVGLRIDPLDTLFFRDGRPFGTAAHGRGGLPMPRTLAGALRTALLASEGFPFDEFANWRQGAGRGAGPEDIQTYLREQKMPGWMISARFRGPWPALALEAPGDFGAIEPLLPTPAILARDDAGWVRSAPEDGSAVPGWPDGDDRRPLWRGGHPDAKPPGGVLRPEGLRAFLAGGLPTDADWLPDDRLFGFDARVGIGIDPDRLTASEGLIYSVRMLALRNDPTTRTERAAEVCFYAELLLGDPQAPRAAEIEQRLADPIRFGGEGRSARVEVVEPFAWSKVASAADGAAGRSLWFLATPGLFGAGASGRPSMPDGTRLRAAASGNPLAVSGWDVAGEGPRPTRFAVPAGAVYFVEGTAEPPGGSLCVDDEDAAQGWGFALPGAWSP